MFGPDKPIITKDEAKAILARSAVVGFGRSAGRDIYRISTNPYVLMALLTFCGTGYAVYDMRCTRKRSEKTNRMIMVGSSMLTFCVLFGMSNSEIVAFVGMLIVQGVSASYGAKIAERNLGPLQHEAKIEAANLDFLDREGFRDVGGRLGTVIDRYGNELIPDDQRSDAFVFRIIGRRSVRAYIWLDDEGRMLEYEPPPGTRNAPRSAAAIEAHPIDEPDREFLCYPLNEKQAGDLLGRISTKSYVVLEEIVLQARDNHAGLLWDEIRELTGLQSWSSFDRTIRSPVHRELRNITSDKNAELLIESTEISLEETDKDEPRYVFIDGPAVSVLQKFFTSAERL